MSFLIYLLFAIVVYCVLTYFDYVSKEEITKTDIFINIVLGLGSYVTILSFGLYWLIHKIKTKN